MWVNHGQSWSTFQTMVGKKKKNLTWKDENSYLGKKLTWFDCWST